MKYNYEDEVRLNQHFLSMKHHIERCHEYKNKETFIDQIIKLQACLNESCSQLIVMAMETKNFQPIEEMINGLEKEHCKTLKCVCKDKEFEDEVKGTQAEGLCKLK